MILTCAHRRIMALANDRSFDYFMHAMIPRYSTPEMTLLWSDESRFQAWFEVEIAACRAMEKTGKVPSGTADRVVSAVKRLDPARILEIEEQTRHDVIAFLTHVEEQAGEPARWLHLGMTSSDVLDTAFGMLLKRSGETILGELRRLREALREQATMHRHTMLTGRTHGIHAQPVTLGLVLAIWYDETGRSAERIRRAVKDVSVGKLSGAVGTYRYLTPAVERDAMARLGLQPAPVSNQIVQRDRHAHFFATLAILAGTLEKVALNLRHLQRTEVSEAFEPFGRGQKGSSAMPHKRNPILSENLCGLARLVRAYADASMENIALWHERDISHSSAERVIAPDATTALHFMIRRLTGVIRGLEVDRDRMRKNLDLTSGLIHSEGVLLALAESGMDRQKAYVLVQKAAMAVSRGKGRFVDLLLGDPEIVRRLGRRKVKALVDHRGSLEHVDEVLDRVLGKTHQRP